MAATVRITSMHVYPVKGMAGMDVRDWLVERSGLSHDRRWMLIDDAGCFISQRTYPQLCRFRAVPSDDSLTVCGPDGAKLTLASTPAEAGDLVSVQVWRDTCEAVLVGGGSAEWFSSRLGFSARLVYMPYDSIRQVNPEFSQPGDLVRFADGYPVLVASTASLSDLNRRMDAPLPMNRFRPNIVVEGCGPFEEDAWSSFSVGAVAFRAAKRCARCQVTATDQETGEVGQEPLRTLATFRRDDGKVNFGSRGCASLAFLHPPLIGGVGCM
jgi:uncharacterized protein YcbX